MKKNLKVFIALSLMLVMFSPLPVLDAVKADTNVNKDNNITEEMNKLKDSYTEYLVGNKEINNNKILDNKINSIHKTADQRRKSYLSEENRVKDGEKALFKNLPLGTNAENLNNSYLYLYQMALAAKTHKRDGSGGPDLYENKETIKEVIDGLNWLYMNFFEDQEAGYYGNWYLWEIGMPTNITKTMILLEDEINSYKPELIDYYIDSMDKYLRKGKDGDVDLNSRFHTGANLADITTNRIIQGALIEEEDRVATAVDNILTVFKTIDPNNIVNGNTDGFYEDGSFIQHHRVAYTGSYGKVLLNRIMQTMIILDGSKYDRKEVLVSTVKEWIYKGFSPVIFEGYMMGIVKGRAISRTSTGYQDVNTVVEAMVELSNYLNEKESERLQSHLKYIATSATSSFSTGSFSSFRAITQFHTIMDDPKIRAKIGMKEEDHHAFNSMDKNVHARKDYAFAISRSSDRISKYEYMSGENLMPWFQGDGAYYLYLSGRDQTKSFGVNYFATIDPYNLPGTTVPKERRKTIPELYNGKLFYENTEHPLNFSASSESQNDYVYFPVGTNTYSGSVELGKYGVAGMQLGDTNGYKDKQLGLLPDDFVVYKNADANKSYFMFDDEIVLLGSGIHDEMKRKVSTTVDNRMFDADEKSTVVGETSDNEKLVNPTNGKYNLEWINFTTGSNGTQIGYYFPKSPKVNVTQDKVTENLKRIRTVNPDKEVTKNFFTLGIDHGKNPSDEKYAYVILPNFNEEQTKSYADDPSIRILSNTKQVQAAEHMKLGIKGFNFFTDKKETVSNITSYNKASIIVKREGDVVTIAVSDPTFTLDKMKLKVKVPDPKVIDASKGVKTSVSRKKALIHIDSNGSNGKSFEIKLKVNGRK